MFVTLVANFLALEVLNEKFGRYLSSCELIRVEAPALKVSLGPDLPLVDLMECFVVLRPVKLFMMPEMTPSS